MHLKKPSHTKKTKKPKQTKQNKKTLIYGYLDPCSVVKQGCWRGIILPLLPTNTFNVVTREEKSRVSNALTAK